MSKDQSGNLQKMAEGRYPYMEQDAATGKGAMLFNERQEIKREAYIAGMQGKEKEVDDFIKTVRESFIGAEVVYTTGSCYQFYKILKLVFPQANVYYNSDHVISEINGRFYDITGEVEKTNHLLMSEHYPNSSVIESRCDAFKMLDQVESVLQENLVLINDKDGLRQP